VKRAPTASIALGAASLALVAGLSLVALESAGKPSAAGSASASAAPIVSAPLLVGSAIPAASTESAEPPAAEWETAPTFRPTRDRTNGAFARACALRVIREWVRLSCHKYFGIELVAGASEGGKVWTGRESADPYQPGSLDLSMARATAIFRLRRGESQIVTLFSLLFGNYGVWPQERETVQFSWREGDPDPHVVVTPRQLDDPSP
jgi:hypothetical protein